MSNINLEIPPDGSVPDTFSVALNDRMRQIQTQFKALTAATPTATAAGASTSTKQTITASAANLQGTHGLRLATNAAGLPAGTQFYETDRHAIYFVQQVKSALTWGLEAAFYEDLFANRPTDLSTYDDGFLFWASDTNVLYLYRAGLGWDYVFGAAEGTLANAPILAMPEAGYLYRITTGTGGIAYNHQVRWNGTGWEPAPLERLGGYFADYAKAPTEPGWQLANGVATKYLDIVAGVLVEVAFTPPDLTTGVYRRGSTAYTGSVHAAGAIALMGNTDDASAGTPAGTISEGAPSSTTDVTASGSGVFVASSAHVHAETFTGTPMAGHHHGLSAVTATLATDPVKNIEVLSYFRR